MKKDSMEEVLRLIIKSNINPIDKTELLINLRTLFMDYENNIKLLSENKMKNKYKR